MRRVRQLPHPIREIEHLWIPLADGVRLAARVWLPDDAERRPVPAILEAIPYRKRDFTRGRDEPMHRYVAGHGYAVVRLDLRGSGDSEGVLHDEYTRREHQDALEVIDWLGRQPWCSGAVGMMGISWGGFNALQVAALRPPRLKAIITIASSDDRYADDAHYMGGCLLNENLTWGSVFMQTLALPPDPELVGDRWRELWRARLAALEPFPAVWLRHPWRDAYWRHGSVAEDHAAIACAVLAVGGWADGYSNAVPRLIAGLSAPCRGLIGPWGHAFPHDAAPGPSIGFLQEAVRWWDQWLKGRDTGVLDEPALRVWMQESVRPSPSVAERPGRWVAEPAWPCPRIQHRRRGLPVRAGGATVRSPLTTGRNGGDWCAFGAEGEMPTDQREDDGGSLVFDLQALTERMELLGAVVVELELASDRPVAQLAVRLNDVWPDGASARVTYGLLNLTHRDGHERPEPLEPGRRYRVRVRLNDVAHAFPAGHRVRVAVSTCYWPIAWPAPEPVTLTVHDAAVELPVRAPRPDDDALRPFGPPEAADSGSVSVLRPMRMRRGYERDLVSNETVHTVFSDGGDTGGAGVVRLDDIGLEVASSLARSYRIGRWEPTSARAEVVQHALLRRDAWEVRLELRTEMTCDRDTFRVRAELVAREGRDEVARRTWDESVERRLV